MRLFNPPLKGCKRGLNEFLCTWKYLKVWDNQMPCDKPGTTPPEASPFLHNQVDVPQGNVLNLGLSRQQGHQRRGKFLQQHVVVVRVLGKKLQELHQDFHRWQHHCWVGVRQPRGHPFTNTGDKRSKRGFTVISERQIFRILSEFRNLAENSFLKHLFDLVLFTKAGKVHFPEHGRKQTRKLVSQLQVSLLPPSAQELFQLSALQSKLILSY